MHYRSPSGRPANRIMLSVALSGALAFPASAQDAPDPDTAGSDGNEDIVAADRTTAPEPESTKNSFEPAYFAQFAPRSALDMLSRVPGFTISDGDNGRGLGQATQNVIVLSLIHI